MLDADNRFDTEVESQRVWHGVDDHSVYDGTGLPVMDDRFRDDRAKHVTATYLLPNG